MNLFRHFEGEIADVLARLVADGRLPEAARERRVAVEPPRETAHGDVATNAALLLAKDAGLKPRAIADMLADGLRGRAGVAAVEIAGPGFVNLRLTDDFWRARLGEILRAGRSYGDSFAGGGEPVLVEFVSANPTGPMHVGHGRGAVVGDALARLLAKAGYKVTREYWINDAGAQVEALARSLYWRYQEALGVPLGSMPEGLYPGDYLIEPARALAERDGRRWLGVPESEWLEPCRAFAVAAMMDLIRADLALLGVAFDVFRSERELIGQGGVDEALRFLDQRGLIYTGVLKPPKGKLPEDWEPRPQTLFRSTQFGDDVDRPLRKSDGSWTYFATDVAYHLDKHRRGFRTMIDVWGADHGGYVKRVQASVKALTGGEGALDVKLCQMVNLMDAGEPIKMSKRAGTFVTLREVVERAGKDVFRFIMLTRKNDAHLDFDFARVLEQTKDNPVFYVQYAHARVRSVLRHAAEALGADAVAPAGEARDSSTPALLAPESLARADFARLADSGEIALMRRMAGWPRAVESAAEAHEPHRIAYFLYDLAAEFHNLWNRGKDDASLRFIRPDAPEQTLARLALVQAVGFVVASGLDVLGVAPVEEMR
ncbi:MAG: arginine--tRNA ligase [Acidimicrobiia bacterium]|nr:arginine--tRNA ligase [Acidimicrobiia bacterium]